LEGNKSEKILQAVSIFVFVFLLFTYQCTVHVHMLYQMILHTCYCNEFPALKVRDLLRDRSTLKSEADGVSILKGFQEGSFMWPGMLLLI
jgi:hypothetical protein